MYDYLIHKIIIRIGHYVIRLCDFYFLFLSVYHMNMSLTLPI